MTEKNGMHETRPDPLALLYKSVLLILPQSKNNALSNQMFISAGTGEGVEESKGAGPFFGVVVLMREWWNLIEEHNSCNLERGYYNIFTPEVLFDPGLRGFFQREALKIKNQIR